VIVGTLMARNVREINWDYMGDAVPAFLTIIIIPLSYNIAYGVIAGIMSYILLNGLPWLLRKVSGERIVPLDYGRAEPWVIPPGGIIPVWMRYSYGYLTNRPYTPPDYDSSPRHSANSSDFTSHYPSQEKGETSKEHPAIGVDIAQSS